MEMTAIGIDLGGTNIRVARVNLEIDVEERIEEQIKEKVGDPNPKAVADQISSMVNSLGGGLIGIGVAGMLKGTSGVVANAPNLGWIDVPFGKILEERLGRPVWLENDVGAIAWGEYRFGVARGCQNVVCVVVGTGVGAGAVLNGEVYRGSSGASMEIGHVKVELDGRLCGCGQRGCLEAYAGGRHIVDQAREDPSDLLLNFSDMDKLNPWHVQEVAEKGDEKCKVIFQKACSYLGLVLANTVTLFNCDSLIIGGTVWNNCVDMMSEGIRIIKEQTNDPAYNGLKLMRYSSEDSGVLGAADLARKEFGF